jgi:hypothetical protein
MKKEKSKPPTPGERIACKSFGTTINQLRDNPIEAAARRLALSIDRLVRSCCKEAFGDGWQTLELLDAGKLDEAKALAAKHGMKL